jgi:hypothetical protein
MAVLSYTPGNPADIQEYLAYYAQLKDDDKKFTLMEMILDAMAQQSNERDFMKYWRMQSMNSRYTIGRIWQYKILKEVG